MSYPKPSHKAKLFFVCETCSDKLPDSYERRDVFICVECEKIQQRARAVMDLEETN